MVQIQLEEKKVPVSLVSCDLMIAVDLLNNGFYPGTLVFTHYASARRSYAPHDLAKINDSKIESVTEMGI